MPIGAHFRLRSFWRRLTRLDRVALLVVVLEGLVRLIAAFVRPVPGSGFVGFLFLLALAYFLLRWMVWARAKLLWSLRNRLIVAYVFIAVVPILLLLTMAVISARTLYSQLGGYLLYEALRDKVVEATDAADAASAAILARGPAAVQAGSSEWISSGHLVSLEAELPGLTFELNTGRQILERYAGARAGRFSGIVQSGNKLSLVGVVARDSPRGRIYVTASVPVTPNLLDGVAPFLGPIQLVVTRPAGPGEASGVIYRLGSQSFQPAVRIRTDRRGLQPPAHWFDFEIQGISKLDAFALSPDPAQAGTQPVFAFFSARTSQLNQRLFSSLGELGGIYVDVLMVVGAIFLGLEVAALITGIILTRTITRAVAELYRATQYVQAGDLTHRIRIQKKDQFGALAESFNLMTSSVSSLIEEQRQRQRLENELSIAREVQAQLFPRSLPSIPGVQLEAVCRAARMVSGDYYDLIQLGPTRLGIVLADISGKGISAALVMASLQAALRSQVLLDGHAPESTAEVVRRLNRHLYYSTSEDRYATLFYGVYDTSTRLLCYTNAGHLPPLYIVGDQVQKLEDGGTVVGLFDDCTYQQGAVEIAPGSLLLAYSDGLSEPENVYGEEFGMQRLLEVTLRYREASPPALAESLMRAAEEWAGSPEQADDMTLIVARLE